VFRQTSNDDLSDVSVFLAIAPTLTERLNYAPWATAAGNTWLTFREAVAEHEEGAPSPHFDNRITVGFGSKFLSPLYV
jgi:hypothetical protein